MTAEYPPAYEHYAVATSGSGVCMARVESSTHLQLPGVLAAFAPALGRARYLRLALRHRHDANRVSYLHVFDRTDGAPTTIDVPVELREPLDRVLAELRGELPVPPLRPPWARPGWHDEVERWAGVTFELLRSWPLAAVLRSGDLYLKASFRLFRAEPVLTAALSDESPGLVPDVIELDVARGWMTMLELPGVPAFELPGERWDAALHTMGRIQQAWRDRNDDLLALGAQDRRLETIDDAGEPSLRHAIDRLAAAPFRTTVGHGDFHPGNVHITGDDNAVVFDWSDACVCHPLLDVALFLQEVEDDDARTRLASTWAEGYGARTADVLAALPAADVVTCLHQRASYTAIVESMEPDDRYLFAGEPQRWLEAALGKAARPG